MPKAAVLGVHLVADPLKPIRVGTLTRNAASYVTFAADTDYINYGPERPILSLSWYDAKDDAGTMARLRSVDDKTAHPRHLPPWFKGLLPEGALSHLVRTEMGHGDHHDFDVLARLGADLPGAVVVTPDDDTYQGAGLRWEKLDGFKAVVPEGKIKFSLAGVQLKFVGNLDNGRLTVPARGHSGRYIVKVPSERHKNLPEVEFAAMKLAEAANVKTAAVKLLSRDAIHDIPAQFLEAGENVLVVERFDRMTEGGRIHIEDFGQVVGAHDERKYAMGSLPLVVNAIRRFSVDPAGDVAEAMRRIAVDIMIGNGDNHLKNWSFIFRNTTDPMLSPAYDIVPTRAYGYPATFAIPFGRTHGTSNISLQRFQRLAEFVEVDWSYINRQLRETVERACDLWAPMLQDLPVPEDIKAEILGYMHENALVREIRPKVHGVPS